MAFDGLLLLGLPLPGLQLLGLLLHALRVAIGLVALPCLRLGSLVLRRGDGGVHALFGFGTGLGFALLLLFLAVAVVGFLACCNRRSEAQHERGADHDREHGSMCVSVHGVSPERVAGSPLACTQYASNAMNEI